MQKIEFKQLEKLEEKYLNKPVQRALRRVLMNNELSSLFIKQEQKPNVVFKFSHEIKTMPVTNQKGTGRCWIFAGLNVIREELAKVYNLKNFELSQNYVAFYDKLEKINYFIESIDDFLGADNDDRTLKHIINIGIQDGGQWDMFVSLVEKYGVVPKEAMVETNSSESTRFMNRIINLKLRKYVAEAKRLFKVNKLAEIKTLKAELIEEMYTFLATNFGIPPKKFDFEYISEDIYHLEKDLTPLEFYKKSGVNLKDYVSIINSPTKDKPYYKTYTVKYLGNVIGGQDVKYLNLSMDELKELTLKQMFANEVVWFGSDVGRHGDRETGIWDDMSYDDEMMLEMNLQVSKEDMLDFGISQMNHAMVLTAVNIKDNKPNRWKIENSWGDKGGLKGYYLASDTWFDKYVYQAIINKKHLTKEQIKAWEEEPIVLKPWDPMGSLA